MPAATSAVHSATEWGGGERGEEQAAAPPKPDRTGSPSSSTREPQLRAGGTSSAKRHRKASIESIEAVLVDGQRPVASASASSGGAAAASSVAGSSCLDGAGTEDGDDGRWDDADHALVRAWLDR